MHWLDTTLLAFMGVASVLGFVTGFFWQVARIVGLTIAIWMSIQFQEPVVVFLHSTLLKGAEVGVAKAVSYVAVFITVYLAIFLLCRSLRQALKASGLDLVDRLLGSMLGLAKMLLVLGGISLLLANVTHPAPKEWMKESTIAPVLAQGMERMIALVPDSYRQALLTPKSEPVGDADSGS
jgi:membrane protein required for colicin V production